MTHCSIDFETRSLLDLPTVGLDNYSKHHSTEVICMAYSIDRGPVQLWHPELSFPNIFFSPKVVIQAWNAGFELHILRNVLGISVKWEQMIDTMAWAAANNVPQSLEEAAIFLGTNQQKDPIGKRLIQKLSKPQKDGTFIKDPQLLQQMYSYCVNDVKTEMALASKLRPITPNEQHIWVLTNKINERGVPIDTKELNNAIIAVNTEKNDIDVGIRAITGGVGASQPAKLAQWLATKDVHVDNLTAETVAKLATNTELAEDVKKVLQYRSEGSSTSVAKFEKMLEIQNGGRIRNLLVYHGASTGRWASRGGLNIQNLPRPSLKDDQIPEAVERILVGGGRGSIPELSSLVRSVIKAPDGHIFLDADFSSIENRVGVWIPGQKDKVDMFREGLDEYKVFASEALYQIPYAEVTKDMRQISKSAVLGCLFGQGPKGLVAYAEGMGVKLSLPQAEMAVNKYRESYFKVKACWHEMEDKAIQAIMSPGTATGLENGRVAFKCSNNALWMRLPSGRLICWQAPLVEEVQTPWGATKMGITVRSQNTLTRQWKRNNLLGSSIFQSSVQGTARDLLAEAVVRLENVGYGVVGLIHDEILCVEQNTDAEDKLTDMISHMTIAPSWAHDIPIAAEGWVGDRFRK